MKFLARWTTCLVSGLSPCSALQAFPKLTLPNTVVKPNEAAVEAEAKATSVQNPDSAEPEQAAVKKPIQEPQQRPAALPSKTTHQAKAEATGANRAASTAALPSNAGAETKSPSPTTPPPSSAAEPADPNALPAPKMPKKQSFSEAEVKAECKKFEGKFIAYYDRIFKAESCKRHELASDDDTSGSYLKGQRVIPVENITIAKIPEGTVLGSSPKGKKPNCAKVEGRYIMSRASDVYFVEKCKKRPFPDWDTYADHSAKRLKKGQEILELPEEEFNALTVGEEFKSSLNDEYKKMLVTEKNVDILPLEEACKGINGAYVSYYAKIYKVDACRKREVDPEQFLLRFPNYKLREMSSEQWVSLPTGKPVKL